MSLTSEPRTEQSSDELLVRAATLYYLQDATQAEIAAVLGTSRSSVSRLLSLARSRGIVQIEVHDPGVDRDRVLRERLCDTLGLAQVWVTPTVGGHPNGPVLAAAVGEALLEAGLRRGDAVLVSSGSTLYEVSRQVGLPSLPGVVMVPTVGGQDEPQAWYQTNEITRTLALACHAHPVFLNVPVMPGPQLYRSLMNDPSVMPVMQRWHDARCALIGIGAPLATRTSLPSVLPNDDALLGAAVGDICQRPYDRNGQPVPFAGSDRMVAMQLEALRRVPSSVGVAVGRNKVQSIVVAARAGYVNRLVTDRETAGLVLAAASSVRDAGTDMPGGSR